LRREKMVNQKRCQFCDSVLKIEAEHNYELSQDINGHWAKAIGDVDYFCTECDTELSISDIRDALEQTDEL
jgi:hypothetical protein